MSHYQKEGSALLAIFLMTAFLMILFLNMQHLSLHMHQVAMQRADHIRYYYITKGLLEYAHIMLPVQNDPLTEANGTLFEGIWPFLNEEKLYGKVVYVQKEKKRALKAELFLNNQMVCQLDRLLYENT